MKKLLPIIIVVVAIVAGLVYFLGHKNNNVPYSASKNNSSKTENMPNQNLSTSNESTQATDKITIKDMAFTPANITIKKGTTVSWTNEDSIGHTVSETDGKQGPSSTTLEKGQTYTFTYTTVGTFRYACSIHPNMTGVVTVIE